MVIAWYLGVEIGGFLGDFLSYKPYNQYNQNLYLAHEYDVNLSQPELTLLIFQELSKSKILARTGHGDGEGHGSLHPQKGCNAS